MTPSDIKKYAKATHCWFCEKPLGEDKVRDHCHISGKYRGAAHYLCNLQHKIQPYKTKIPIFFHNLEGYDAHLIMQSVAKTDWPISVIPKTDENYISFTLANQLVSRL